jgi:hypothetical protein
MAGEGIGNMDALELKAIMARYLRFDRACPLLALESPSMLENSWTTGGAADLLAVDKSGHLIEIEVKVSISDLRADRNKEKHNFYRKVMGMPYKNKVRKFGHVFTEEPNFYPTHLFYFAVTPEIANEAKLICENLYPYAGLLRPINTWYTSGIVANVHIAKKPRAINPDKISFKQIALLAKSQSATVVRLLEVMADEKQKGC